MNTGIPIGTSRGRCGGNGRGRARGARGFTPWFVGTESDSHRGRARGARGFTLMEILLAGLVFSVLLAALYSVFQSSYRLRESAYAALGRQAGIDPALAVIRRDLIHALLPEEFDPTLEAGFLGDSGSRAAGGNSRLEFYTTSGKLTAGAPWSALQRVRYELSEETGADGLSRELLRAETRNLLQTAAEQPRGQPLLGGVQDLQFDYFDGAVWQESWDSTALARLPGAVRLRIDFAQPAGERRIEPAILICAITTAADDTTTETVN